MNCDEYRPMLDKTCGQMTSAERIAGLRHYLECEWCRVHSRRMAEAKFAVMPAAVRIVLEVAAVAQLAKDLNDPENRKVLDV